MKPITTEPTRDAVRALVDQIADDDLATAQRVLEALVRDAFVPNAETIAAMEAARRGEFDGSAESIEELFEALHADDADN